MTKLTIERGGKLMSVLSKFKVTIDGTQVAKLGHGKSATIEVAPGTHEIHIHSLGTDGGTRIDVPVDGLHIVTGYRNRSSPPQLEFWAHGDD